MPNRRLRALRDLLIVLWLCLAVPRPDEDLVILLARPVEEVRPA